MGEHFQNSPVQAVEMKEHSFEVQLELISLGFAEVQLSSTSIPTLSISP